MPRLSNAALCLILLSLSTAVKAVTADLPAVTVRKLPAGTSRSEVCKLIRNLPPSVSQFIQLQGERFPTQQTEVRLAYDDANIYAAFTCHEDRMDKLTDDYTKHDDMVYRDDSVEVFLSQTRTPGEYFHFISNVEGVKYEEKGKPNVPGSWNGAWSVRVEKRPKEWEAVITIPFASIGTKMPKEGAVWFANFSRHERPSEEMSCWSPAVGGLHSPDRFGTLVFGGRNAVTASVGRIDVRTPGRHWMSVSLSNPTKSQTALRATVFCDGKTLTERRITAAPNDSRTGFTFYLPQDGEHTLVIRLADAANRNVITQTAPIPTDIPPYLTRLREYQAALKKLSPKSRAGVAEKQELAKAVRDAAATAESASSSATQWTRLGQMLDGLHPKITRLRYVCADDAELGYAVGWETSVRKVLRDPPFEGSFTKPASVELCRNDYEAVQIVLVPYRRNLKDVSVSISDLTRPDGAVIPSDAVDLKVVGYVKTGRPPYPVDYVGWYPDPLMDLKPFNVPVGQVQPVWITFHPSEETRSGVYHGEVTIKPANAAASTFPVTVKVWDFSLPKETHLKTAFALSEGALSSWYGGLTDNIRRAYEAFLLDHRINPTNIYSRTPQPRKDDIPFCIERGMNAFNLGLIGYWNDERRREFVETTKDYEAFLKQNGWWDKAYIYGFDEIKQPRYPELKEMYGFIEQQFPDLPRMCTVVPNDELKGYVDIWVPLTANYKKDAADERTRAGDQVWWYVCCSPWHPYANWFIDYPAIDQRIIFWMNWKYHVPGILYYSLNHWESNRTTKLSGTWVVHPDPEAAKAISEGKRWPEVPWNTFTFKTYNGDGHLIYPGPNGRPISSVRFECIRDGIEDYEYLYKLNQTMQRAEKKPGVSQTLLAKARKLLAVPDRTVKSLTEYTMDPQVLLQSRREIAETIEKLSAGLRSGN